MEQSEIKLFDGQNIRYVWDEEKEQYFFSVVDVIQVLTESPRPRKYWNALKTKLQAEGSEVSQNMGQLKLPAPDGKLRLTDVAISHRRAWMDTEPQKICVDQCYQWEHMSHESHGLTRIRGIYTLGFSVVP